MTEKHRFEIQAPVSEVYEAISTLGGLRSWWTSDLEGSPVRGGELKLGFGNGFSWVMRVADTRNNKWVVWTMRSSTFPSKIPFTETKISIRLLEAKDHGAIVIFEHENNPYVSDLYRSEWKASLKSLKLLCETGKGEPKTPKRVSAKKAAA